MGFPEEYIGCLDVKNNNFSALLYIHFVDKPSFGEFHGFYFRKVGKYACKTQVDILFAKAEIGTSLIQSCTDADNVFLKLLFCHIQVFIVQPDISSLFQSFV